MAADNPAFDPESCDVEAVQRIPQCDNLLLDPRISEPPADIQGCDDPPLELPPEVPCPEINPTAESPGFAVVVYGGSVLTNPPALGFRFVEGDCCDFTLEMDIAIPCPTVGPVTETKAIPWVAGSGSVTFGFTADLLTCDFNLDIDIEAGCPELTPQAWEYATFSWDNGQEGSIGWIFTKGDDCDYDLMLDIDVPCPEITGSGTVSIVMAPAGSEPSGTLSVVSNGCLNLDLGLSLSIPSISGGAGGSISGSSSSGVGWETISYISGICPRHDACGNVDGYTYTYQTKRVLVDASFSSTTSCDTGGANCCDTTSAVGAIEGISCTSCVDVDLPRYIKITFHDTTGSWTSYEGVELYFEHDDANPGYWDLVGASGPLGVRFFEPVTNVWQLFIPSNALNHYMLVSRLVACSLPLGIMQVWDFSIYTNAIGSGNGICSGIFWDSDDECMGWLGETYTTTEDDHCGSTHATTGGIVSFTSEGITHNDMRWGDAGSGGCSYTGGDTGCTTADGYLSVDGTTDFLHLNDIYPFVYDPTAIDTLFTGDTAYDGRFQWYCEMHDTLTPGSVHVFFGLLGSTYYFGFASTGMTLPFPQAACFAMTLHEGETMDWYSVAADASSCAGESLSATLDLTGTGGGDCDGTLALSVSI